MWTLDSNLVISAKQEVFSRGLATSAGTLGKLWLIRLRTPKSVSTVQSDPFFVF
jgi:hypothetical protein